ncbi:MAG: hypothetical protein IT239_02885 [Bacteroidia bacterium]|nr:hypothetical protein [Bacteroidia bacterium]
MYKVFIQNKPIEIIGFNDPIEQVENTLIMRYWGDHDYDTVKYMVEHVPTLVKIILLSENPDTVFEDVKKKSA